MTVAPIYVLPIPAPLDGDPLTALLSALEHVAGLDATIYANRAELRLTLYHSALCDLAGTYSERGQQLYDRAAERLPSGTVLVDAAPDELRRYTLAYHGLARDRLTHGTVARDLATWLELANEAVSAYRLPRAA